MVTTTAAGSGAGLPPKQIRFVNNQGQPPSKRRRVNAACLTCRKRKTRCDGEKPSCSTCEKHGHQCLGYPDHPSPEKSKDDPTSMDIKVVAGDSSHNETMDEDGKEEFAGHDNEGKALGENDKHRKSEPRPSSAARRDSITKTAMPPSRTRKESNGWERDSTNAHHTPGRPSSNPRTTSFSDDGRSVNKESPAHHHSDTHKVPYFRYFGPTAIVPGLKQMVVNAPVQKYSRRRSSRGSISSASPLSLLSLRSGPSHAETVLEPMDELPAYDPDDKAPVPAIIIKLVETFFLHLGYIHPFLREEKILRLVKEKKVESILVDAMCALAARFANFDGLPAAMGSSRSEYGNVFAQRAKNATVDTFPCPTVGAVQAYLLMAYEGFGANQDSALWMYLGLAIRMAFDLGLQRNEGVQYQGEKDPWYTYRAIQDDEDQSSPVNDEEQLDTKEQEEIVQQRIDTAWAVYILDRVISTGTGRTATVRDDEFELPIPKQVVDPATNLPAPYPVFAHIIQLYGRVSDIINKLKKPSDLTADMLATLAKIERELTGLHRKQDPRLHFNPLHFQNYVKSGKGTLFILLHVWFHSCIIILHQPLLTPFGNQRRQLTPGSRELAMSSAKSIADILALAEFIDPNTYLSSPFTSQPMYIAACAFLVQSASHISQPPSRAGTPGPERQQDGDSHTNVHNGRTGHSTEATGKHSLLAEAAIQCYQRCYKSLQQLHEYWGGVKYILNALDHRSKGIWDCETYTAEEYASTKLPRRPNFPRADSACSPAPNFPPLAWSLTGTTNSPNSSLSVLYQNTQAAQIPPPPPPPPASAPTPPGNWRFDPVRPDLPTSYSPAFPQPNTPAVRYMGNSSHSNRKNTALPTPSNFNGRHVMKFDSLPPSTGTPGTPADENRLNTLSGMSTGTKSGLSSLPYTPSSNYESFQGCASPSGSNLADRHNSTQQNRAVNHFQNTAVNTVDVSGTFGLEFSHNGMASAWNMPSTIMVEQIDLGSVEFSDDMFGPWDLWPGGNISDLFDPANLGNTGDQEQASHGSGC